MNLSGLVSALHAAKSRTSDLMQDEPADLLYKRKESSVNVFQT